MLKIRKYKALLSFSLMLLVTSAFSIKGLHQLDSHHHAPVCKEINLKHLHENHQHPDCHLCDFIFSPFTEHVLAPSVHSPHYFPATAIHYHSPDFSSLCIVTYRLRGPPQT